MSDKNSIQVRIRAFRAVDDPETCQKFIDGHLAVLESVGVKKVTSANNDWMYNPAAFPIVVESMDRSKVYGGARIHCADGKTPLPLEEAAGYMDNKIYKVVKELAKDGTGELCGLWNSVEVSGLGVGAFIATRAGVAMCTQLGIKTLFALCAPYTVSFAKKVGCIIYRDVGNDGTFYYPKLDLLATVVLLPDLDTLQMADAADRDKMFSLREDPKLQATEFVTKKNVEIEMEYDLLIPNADPNEFKIK